MGQQTKFTMGDSAPNDGEYVEVGSNAFHTSINDPQHVHLKKGEKFPRNSNDDRKWTLTRPGKN